MKNQIKPFEKEKYAEAKTIEKVENALPPDTDKTLHELPAVMRMPEGGWGLYMVTVQGKTVLSRLKLHGPDIRRICLAKAIRLLER
jgi:hypothetical protein